MSISNAKLRFWATHNYNVCFSGKHGVGKTSIVESLFNELYGTQGEDWLYFSSSTMDPWVDFIGVPKETIASDGTQYLTLIRPEIFARDKVKAIFMDEFNRAPKKVRNAVMELLQFKSINGHKFNNLKIIWTAINPPEEDSYDVEEIDPAQKDRFHITVDIPYTVSKAFFVSKYGEDAGSAAVSWWNSLPKASKDLVSPRRLDYAVDCFTKGGDLRDIFSKEINPKDLILQLNSGSFKEKLKKLYEEKNEKETKKVLSDIDFVEITLNDILKKEEYVSYFFKFMPSEIITNFICKTRKPALAKVLVNFPTTDNVKESLEGIIGNNSTTKAKVKLLREWILSNWPDSELGFDVRLQEMLLEADKKSHRETTYQRIDRCKELVNYIKRTNVSYNETLIKKFYDYIITAMDRSQAVTYNRFVTSDFKSVMKDFNKKVNYEAYLRKRAIGTDRKPYLIVPN